jgi:hypothetical protein
MNEVKLACVTTLAWLLVSSSPLAAQYGAVRGYPAGLSPAATPYYTNYQAQFGYAFPPASAAGYQPAYAAYIGGAQTAYYAPSYAAPAANYTLSPAGGASAGAEAFAYYGQPAPLNYVPPSYYGYQTRIVQVPVTYYRPYTVYQPGTGVPVTCQRAVTTTTCQPQRHWCSSFWDWLLHRNRCASGAGGAGAPTTAYCVPAAAPSVVQPSACGTPYYNTVPPATVVPGTVLPGTTASPAPAVPSPAVPRILGPSTTVPPPGTRTIVPPAGAAPSGADVRPSIPPSTTIPPTTLGPSGASVPRHGRGAVGSASGSVRSDGPMLTRPAISEPSLGPRRSVQPVPDPSAGNSPERDRPGNRAPQLINPNDRTAGRRPISPRDAWGVIPATWPERKPAEADAAREGHVVPAARHVPAADEAPWDSTQWKSVPRS